MTTMALAVDHGVQKFRDQRRSTREIRRAAARQRTALSVVIHTIYGASAVGARSSPSSWRRARRRRAIRDHLSLRIDSETVAKKTAGNLTPAGLISNSKCYFSASTPASETTSS